MFCLQVDVVPYSTVTPGHWNELARHKLNKLACPKRKNQPQHNDHKNNKSDGNSHGSISLVLSEHVGCSLDSRRFDSNNDGKQDLFVVIVVVVVS